MAPKPAIFSDLNPLLTSLAIQLLTTYQLDYDNSFLIVIPITSFSIPPSLLWGAPILIS